MTAPAPRFRPGVEALESRDVPSTVILSESFEQVAPPATPTGWTSWSLSGQDSYLTTRQTAANGLNSLSATGSYATRSRFWLSTPQSADAGVSVRVRTDAQSPAEVIVRGQYLDSDRASYLAAVLSPGLRQVHLIETQNGTRQVLATMNVAASVSGIWAGVTIQPNGSETSVRVHRPDTNQFLNAQGTWQSTPTDAIRSTVNLRPSAGLVGLGRAPGGQGNLFLDSFEVSVPTVQEVRQSFDLVPLGQRPTGWQSWTSDGTAGFATSSLRSVSPTQGFAANGTSVTAARAWYGTAQPANVQASISFYADSLIPGALIVRGANLESAQPTYYSLTVTRGLKIQLTRVVNGVETVLTSLNSKSYFSAGWVRLTLVADGDLLRAIVYRTDVGEWLDENGEWQDLPQPAIEKTDTGIRSGGFVGIHRARLAAGTILFDDFEVRPASTNAGPSVSVSALQSGSTFANDVTFRAVADPAGSARRVEFRLDGTLRGAAASTPAEWTLDTTLLANGTHTLVVRAIDLVGNVGSATLIFNTQNSNPNPNPSRPELGRKLSHIRIAQLAYSGNPMGAFEQSQIRNAVDLVIPNTKYLQTIDQAAPTTPQLIYSNISNLYQGLLTDWLNFADRNGVARELAFYHVTRATPFTGASPSSQPVNRFWAVHRGSAMGGTQTNLTSSANGGGVYGVTFGNAGEAVAIGYPDRFREINYTLNRGAVSGWQGMYEYVSAVGSDGAPTAWKPLRLLVDSTSGMIRTGQVTFDPPKDWVAAAIGGSTSRLFYVRVRTVVGNSSQAPDAKLIVGRDYVGAAGRSQGTIPAFDYLADRDGDGYLSDSEFAQRTPGKDARFVYESRLFYPYYGQMRFVTNPNSSAIRHWAADYHQRQLNQFTLADGFFLDNTSGRIPFSGTPVVEPTLGYGEETANLVSAVWRAIAPRMVVSNTSGGVADADGVTRASTGVFEEFVLRATEANWSNVNDVANLVNRRLTADSPAPYVILDTHPGTLPTTDNRVRTSTLAYYYLLADPNRTMMMFFGGYAPSASWSQTWIPAATVDVGQPAGAMSVWATGKDPENTALEYRVLKRDYGKALMLYKPRSYTLGKGSGTINNATATTHNLDGTYRILNGDGTLGSTVTSVTLRNGEGVVLMRVS